MAEALPDLREYRHSRKVNRLDKDRVLKMFDEPERVILIRKGRIEAYLGRIAGVEGMVYAGDSKLPVIKAKTEQDLDKVYRVYLRRFT